MAHNDEIMFTIFRKYVYSLEVHLCPSAWGTWPRRLPTIIFSAHFGAAQKCLLSAIECLSLPIKHVSKANTENREADRVGCYTQSTTANSIFDFLFPVALKTCEIGNDMRLITLIGGTKIENDFSDFVLCVHMRLRRYLDTVFDRGGNAALERGYPSQEGILLAILHPIDTCVSVSTSWFMTLAPNPEEA